jgi:phenylalanyl-tRNA synthetase beta chain
MPTISVGRDRLFASLGKTYSELPLFISINLYNCFFMYKIITIAFCFTAQEEFEDLCFSFGIELDDVVSNFPFLLAKIGLKL